MINIMRLLNVILSVGCGIIVFTCMVNKNPSDLIQISGTYATVAGTLLGFLVAALSILIAVSDRPLAANLRKTGHYKVLLHEIYLSATAYLTTVIVSLVTLFLSGCYVLTGTSIATMSMVSGTLFFISSGRKFTMLMTHL